MSTPTQAEKLARLSIDCWNKGTPELLPLADSFVHTSPLGRIEGRSAFLEMVKPLTAENDASLKTLRAMGNGNEAVIHYEMQTPGGLVQCCDWVMVKDDEITEIHSFYDATGLR